MNFRTCHRVKLKAVLGHCPRACGTRKVGRACGEHEDGNGQIHQESVMGGGANALGGNVGGAGFGGAKFMQGMFTAIEQVAFMSTEEEKEKQFMRGLRPSVRNKIVRNLIKVYSIIVSSDIAIEETLIETRKILNPKSQHDGTSAQSEGHYSKKPSVSTLQQHYRSAPAIPQHHLDIISKEEQSRSDRISPTYAVNLGLEGHSSIYVNVVFLSIRTTSFGSTGSENSGASLCYDISGWTIKDSKIAGVATRYLYSMRYFPCV
ncbi:hypothetical protein Acr_00g0020380 [Actinidia rufa]|uniref:Uncharacterized protein n=1 Tax=Actinidia rufa TaxID=165716 RepID=A0A7J0DC99_9ERIC|nr:hypothetical protein Acr_00g0020380 [Actinidia rufa]